MSCITGWLGALGVKSCDQRQLYRYRDFFQTYPQIAGGALSPQFASLMPPAPESSAETSPSQKVGSVTPQLSIPPDRLLNSLSDAVRVVSVSPKVGHVQSWMENFVQIMLPELVPCFYAIDPPGSHLSNGHQDFLHDLNLTRLKELF